MKRVISYSLLLLALNTIMVSCKDTSYKKMPSGLLYRIVSSGSKDSVAKTGQYIKFNLVHRLNDSVLQSTHGKMPAYLKLPPVDPSTSYSPIEVLPLLKTGDSAMIMVSIDSMVKKNLLPQLPPGVKKEDNMSWGIKIIKIFRDEASYTADQTAELKKDEPRRKKEQEDEMAKMQKEMETARDAEEAEMEKSGEAAKGIQEMQAYLTGKGIQAEKVGKGTFVLVKEKGTGPAVAPGKFVKVKYAGRMLKNDKEFESNQYEFQVDRSGVIGGWHEGMKSFNQGGKGTLYIPGFRAYGKNARPPFGEFEPLIFEVEILSVSDTPVDSQ